MAKPRRGSAPYPLVLLAHKNLSQSTSWGDDLTQVSVAADVKSWSASKQFSTPTNTAGIVQISPAVNYHGHGAFVLYRTASGALQVYGEFLKPDSQSKSGNIFKLATEVCCPSGK
jgi:hypothetical protein